MASDESRIIKIGPICYQVVDKPDLRGAANLDGQICYGVAEIRLDPNLAPGPRRVTLWHEVLHAILTQGGFAKHDERMIDVLAYGVMQVLQDSPWLAEYAGGNEWGSA